MKWLLPFLFVSSSFACVDLTGVYKECGRISGSSTTLPAGGFTIYKPEANGNVFMINGKTILADGNSRMESPEETGNDTDLNMMYSCDENSFTRVLTDPANPKLEITQTFTKRETNLLVSVSAAAPYNHINDFFVCD